MKDLLSLAISLQQAQIEAQLAAATHQRIAADLDRALTILAGTPAGHPDAASPAPPASGPSFSDGPWLGGGNGSRDVFDAVHVFPKGRWT